jgi:thioredoxin reductase
MDGRFDCIIIGAGPGGLQAAIYLGRYDRGKFLVNRSYESTLSGLYIVGPLNIGPSQIVVAAGQGAVVAMDIKKRLLEI